MSALPIPQVQQHPASVDAYIRHGWSLVPIPSGTKGPRTPGWNRKENALRSQSDLASGSGIGLAHAYSGTMALDIDSWQMAANVLKEHGVDLPALYDAPDAVIIDSGRQGHGKLLYQMPFGMALPSKKITIAGVTVYELRCATANGLTVQDVLPPSIHPSTGQPYRWAGCGHFTRLPVIPQALLDLWQSLLALDVKTIPSVVPTDVDWGEIHAALQCIPPSCSREEWITVGMALHWAEVNTGQQDYGLSLWNNWSALAPDKYPGERDILTQWNSFRSDKNSTIKLGSLFHVAKDYGYQKPLPDITSMFSAVTADSPEVVTETLSAPSPRLDIDLFPEVLRKYAQEISTTRGCDPLVPLFAGLGAICAAADARTRLELLPGFRVPPILWLMTIGEPADKKTPGSSPMFEVLTDIQNEDAKRFESASLEYEGKEAAYNVAHKSYLDYCASPEGLLSQADAPTVGEKPRQPVRKQLLVTDVTSQKLVRIVAERPEGVLCYLDEMNGWVRKITDKTSGDDRSAWVQAYEGKPYLMDRVMGGSIHCENLAVSIYGNIQPRVFRDALSALSSDGLLQRFVPCVLEGKYTVKPSRVPSMFSVAGQWGQMLRLVHSLPPMEYSLSPSAVKVYDEFQDWYYERKVDERILDNSDAYMTAHGKLEGLAGRFMLVFHLVENPFSNLISEDVATRVCKLVRTYVIPALRYTLMEYGDDGFFSKWMKDHLIYHSDKQTITLSEIKRSGRRQLKNYNSYQSEAMVLDAMATLEDAKWVIRAPGEDLQRHRVEWYINPSISSQFHDHRVKVIAAKQRRVEEMYKDNPYGRIPSIKHAGLLREA